MTANSQPCVTYREVSESCTVSLLTMQAELQVLLGHARDAVNGCVQLLLVQHSSLSYGRCF